MEVSVYAVYDGNRFNSFSVFSSFEKLAEDFLMMIGSDVDYIDTGNVWKDTYEVKRMINDGGVYSCHFQTCKVSGAENPTQVFIVTDILGGQVNGFRAFSDMSLAKQYVLENIAYKVGYSPSGNLDKDIEQIKHLLKLYTPQNNFFIMGFKRQGDEKDSWWE